MPEHSHFSRRGFLAALGAGLANLSRLGTGALVGTGIGNVSAAAAATAPGGDMPQPAIAPDSLLSEFEYGQVQLGDGLAHIQFISTIDALMQIPEDGMLKPYRERAGLPAPGKDLGGWYDNFAGYDYKKPSMHGFAPGHCFGQWISALSRAYAITGSGMLKERVNRLVSAYAQTISPKFYTEFRFPAYTYDKLMRGMLDAYLLTGNQEAWNALQKTTETVRPFLPDHATDHGDPKPGRDMSWTWDEPYTLPEHLFMTYLRGGGQQYLDLAKLLLIDRVFFTLLAQGQNALANKHAYSHCNALSSAIQAYLILGSTEHLQAAHNAFDIINDTQSFATGGWGPDEGFIEIGSGKLGKSLTSSHRSFETPCGAYAHFKLTRYLLRITRDPKYGDSMERVLYNTVLGAKPLQADGRTFYYSDYNFHGKKVYHKDNFPCCAGTLPQVTCDNHINIYFTDKDGIYVNLYVNSTAAYHHDGQRVSITQLSEYPADDKVRFTLNATSDKPYAIRFRIPAWTSNATLFVNGKDAGVPIAAGSFAEIRRVWNAGDSIELTLPMSLRLVSVDPQHTDTVALMNGPLVLMAILDDTETKVITKAALLSAKRSEDNPHEWSVTLPHRQQPMRFLPFTHIIDETYSAYLKVES